MLLRQFRKIDTYSWIKLLLLGVLVAILKSVAKGEGIVETLIFLVLFLALGSLTSLLFKERWAFKGTHFRYLVFAVFLLLWSVSEVGYELLIWSFLLELQWQFAENFKQRKNSSWLLHNATIAALVPLFTGGNGLLFSLISMFILLRTANLKIIHALRWALGFAVPLLIGFIGTGQGWFSISLKIEGNHQADLSVLIPIAIVFLLTLNQALNSYRRANLTNKMRSIAAGYSVILGGIGTYYGMGTIALAMALLGLSYQLANALYYLKGKWYVEVIAILFTVYSILLIFGVTLPI